MSSRVKLEVSDIIASFVDKLPTASLTTHHRRTFSALMQCRTSALGGHKQKCDSCTAVKIQYNSCRNRHCPKCQGINKEMFTIMQEDMLLTVPYFHVVFTLPHEFNDLCIKHPKEMYDLLFSSAWHTIRTLALDPKWLGAQSAATMILHTWSQNLKLHPHLHCIVPSGGLNNEGNWQNPRRSGPNYLFPSEVMKPIFRGYFMQHLRKLIKQGLVTLPINLNTSANKWLNSIYDKKWVIHLKKPFCGVSSVVEYLARYSHKVAITNHRIMNLNSTHVTFVYKDYKDGAKKKTMELKGEDFLHRFKLHILPSNFRKVRQYGFTSNATKKNSIEKARKSLHQKHQELLNRKERKKLAIQRILGINPSACKSCKTGMMVPFEGINRNKDPPMKSNLDKIYNAAR